VVFSEKRGRFFILSLKGRALGLSGARNCGLDEKKNFCLRRKLIQQLPKVGNKR